LIKEEMEMQKRWLFIFLSKTERSGKKEPEVGEEVECCSSGMM
jgi:hypothetical protein